MLMFVVVMALALLMAAGWWLTRAISHRWHTSVTIPRIARRECARIDQEYRELLDRVHRRPNETGR